MRTSVLAFQVPLLVVAILPGRLDVSSAQGVLEVQELLSTTGSPGYFGRSVSLAGNRALIGLSGLGFPEAAYVFEAGITGWVQQDVLVPSGWHVGFGTAVAIEGDAALVSSYVHDPWGELVSAVYVFEKSPDGWDEKGILVPSDGWKSDEFGASISLQGNRAIVGAPSAYDSIAGTYPGAAYVFERTQGGWVEQTKLIWPTTTWSDFGRSVALEGSTAIVGSPRVSPVGAAYVFELGPGGWTKESELLPSIPVSGYFGRAVSCYGSLCLVGADAEVAFVYERLLDGWHEQAKLYPPAGPYSVFGSYLDLDDDRAIVAAPGADEQGAESGTVYLYDRDGNEWSLTAKLLASDGSPGDLFGMFGVVVSSDWALVSAGNHDHPLADLGAVYVFDSSAPGIVGPGLASAAKGRGFIGGSIRFEDGYTSVPNALVRVFEHSSHQPVAAAPTNPDGTYAIDLGLLPAGAEYDMIAVAPIPDGFWYPELPDYASAAYQPYDLDPVADLVLSGSGFPRSSTFNFTFGWPVLLLHGWPSSCSWPECSLDGPEHFSFIQPELAGSLSEALISPKEAFIPLVPNLVVGGAKDYYSNYAALLAKLQGLAQVQPGLKYQVVGYSQGGLVARMLTHNMLTPSDYLTKVVQIATPNAGTCTASYLCPFDPSACLLTEESLAAFNTTYTEGKGLPFFQVAGNKSLISVPCLPVDPLGCGGVWPSGNDEVVSVMSVGALTWGSPFDYAVGAQELVCANHGELVKSPEVLALLRAWLSE